MSAPDLQRALRAVVLASVKSERSYRRWRWIHAGVLCANVLLAAFNVSVACVFRFDWLQAVAIFGSVYAACVSLHSWRRIRRLLLLEQRWRAAISGISAAVADQNLSLYQHHDDQADAVLADLQKLGRTSWFRPQL